jgi:single-stranded DNA-specific DHH superfamily exonuclease
VNQGYIPSSRTAYELTRIKKWLSLIGVIADSGNLYKENDNFIKEALEELNLTLEEFQKDYAHIFSDTIVYFADTPEKIFGVLVKLSSLQDIKKLKKYANEVEEEIQKYVKEYEAKKEKISNINFYQFQPKFQIKGIVAAIISRGNKEEIFIFLSKKNSDPNILGISARDQRPNANLPKLLEAATKGLENSDFGGHPRASGGQIMAKDLKKFKQNIKEFTKK